MTYPNLFPVIDASGNCIGGWVRTEELFLDTSAVRTPEQMKALADRSAQGLAVVDESGSVIGRFTPADGLVLTKP